jgi:hypothetical protein
MVVIPARHQVRPERTRWATALRALGLGWYLLRQNEAIVAHFATEGIPYVDTTPALAAHDAIAPVMFADDPHTNALGHGIVAGIVAERMAPMVAEVLARRHRRSGGAGAAFISREAEALVARDDVRLGRGP